MNRHGKRNLVIVVATLEVLSGTHAAAQSSAGQAGDVVETAPAGPPEGAPPTAPPVTSAPASPPADVSGLLAPRDPDDPPTVAKAALAPVRGLWFAAWAPVRLALWAYDRYAIPARIRQLFFSEDGNLGLFPTVSYTSGFGLSAGIRFIARNQLAPGSRIKVDLQYGGEVLQAYLLKLDSGRLAGDTVRLGLTGGFRTSPRNRFFGVGNADLVSADGMTGVDALADPTAVATRYYYDTLFAEASVGLALPGPFGAQVSAGYQHSDFDFDLRKGLDDDDIHTFAVYDPESLVGATDGLARVAVDAEVALDTLEQPRFYVSRALPSRGWYVAARGGHVRGTGRDPSRFVRWGLDARRYVSLYGDDRILVLRALWRGVTGSSLADVPFIDLPALGGAELLRGYPPDRFRDRQAGMASAEYQWSVDRNLAGFMFVDAGRVWRDRDALSDGDLRVGFGGGLQVHSMKNFLGRVLLSSSIDGELFVQLSFDPLFETRRELR
jgi:hypothetical protein